MQQSRTRPLYVVKIFIYIRNLSPLQSGVDVLYQTNLPNNWFHLTATVLDFATQFQNVNVILSNFYPVSSNFTIKNRIMVLYSTIEVVYSINALYFMASEDLSFFHIDQRFQTFSYQGPPNMIMYLWTHLFLIYTVSYKHKTPLDCVRKSVITL